MFLKIENKIKVERERETRKKKLVWRDGERPRFC